MFQEVFDKSCDVCCITQMDIVYDTYTEISLKELERIRRAKLVEPLTYVNIHNDTPIP